MCCDITTLNTTARIEHCQPPNYDSLEGSLTLSSTRESANKNRKKQDLLAAMTNLKPPNSWTTKVVVPKLGEYKSKDPKVRRRNVISQLFKETKFPRIHKFVTDAHKAGLMVRRLSSRISADDPISQVHYELQTVFSTLT